MCFDTQLHISSMRNGDIISDKEFHEANNVFENMLLKLKESGKEKFIILKKLSLKVY